MRGGHTADGPVIGVRVPAKINLFLAVRGARPDGYHEVVSVLQTVSVHDRLRVAVVGPPGRSLHPAGRRRMRVDLWYDPAVGLPPPEDNLVIRAARALGSWTGTFDLAPPPDPPGAAPAREPGGPADRRRGAALGDDAGAGPGRRDDAAGGAVGGAGPGRGDDAAGGDVGGEGPDRGDDAAGGDVTGDRGHAVDVEPDLNGLGIPRLRDTRGPRTVIDLDKGIPVAGGMAGGSADAAGALVALNALWGCGLGTDELRQVAASIGSDVPFCVVGGTALATGRGTALAQVLCRGTFHWVIGEADEPLETADVYRAWDERCHPSEIEPDAVLAALRSGDAVALGAALHNDLEPAAMALRPELAEHKAALLDAGALGAVMSGSGPTMVALAPDLVTARALGDAVRHRFRSVSVARSPAGGPELDR